VLQHVLEHVVYARDELADHGIANHFEELDEVLVATAPGAGGVMFLPWLSGSLAPQGSSSMRGGFVHMSLETGRRDLVRAVVEGVAHNLAWLLPHVEAFTGTPIAEIAFVGGAARSAPWCQVLADVLDRPILPLPAPEHSAARAMALLALARHGVPVRAGDDAPSGRRYEPTPEHRTRYAERQVQFEAAYAALLPISEALS
jgi:xylulokinase